MIGSRYSQDTFRVRDFLAKNRVLFTWLDLEADPQVKQLLKQFGLTEADTPVVAWGHKLLLRNPSNRELAEALGLRRPLEQTVYDLVVVGAGPAGLAAAVYGASEGLQHGGAGAHRARAARPAAACASRTTSASPPASPAAELAERAVLQANKFGAQPARRHAGHAPDVRQRLPGAAPRRRRDGRRPSAC